MARLSANATVPTNKRLVVRADLVDSNPPIWRRLEIAPELRLHQVHRVLQAAFLWEDSHLHEFVTPENPRTGEGQRRFNGAYVDDLDVYPESESEMEITLGELLVKKGDTLTYRYDFGDSWEVTLKLEKTAKVWLARCVGGSRACPPDDSGGIWAYEWALATSKNPADPDYESAMERMEWLSGWMNGEEWDPDAFDLEATDKDVRNSV